MNRLFDDPAHEATGRFAQVALEQGIDASAGGLTYAIPQALADLRVGERVMVPLGRGNKAVAGFVLELTGHSRIDPDKIKSILARDRTDISLTPDLVLLAGWIAGYYCCPIGMVFSTMLPAAVKRGTGRVSQVMVALAGEGISDLTSASSVEPGSGISDLENQEGTLSEPQEPSETKDAARRKRLSKMQAAVLEAMRQRTVTGDRWMEIKALADLAGARSIAPVRQLVDKGLLIARHQEVVLAMRGGVPEADAGEQAGTPLTLNDAQRKAIDRVVHSIHAGFSVHLLHGITGSGKTEVYLRVLEEVLKAGERCEAASGESGGAGLNPPLPNPKSEIPARLSSPKSDPRFFPSSAIVLVPEIALTPQTVARFVSRFDSVAVMHSGLSAAQRHEQWRRIRSGQARIVVGARSAVFAPLPNLKLIVVDEEHEQSYKQDQLPRYQARDVAIKRGQLLNIPVVLGSATPSLESYYNATGGGARVDGSGEGSAAFGVPQAAAKHEEAAPTARKHYHLHNLPQRIAGLTLPKVEIVDMSEERRKRYEYTGRAGVHLLSVRLEKVLQQALEAKGQVMLLLNRRGYANYIACPDHRCGWMMNCELCDATMVYHKDAALPLGGLVRCHHCTAEQLLPAYCPTCGKKVTVFGLGTQRVEEEISRKFPGARVLRMDSDVMRTGRDYQRSLESFHRREVDVLVGTQMIAKGLDFPNVHVVGVISADTALSMPDFRAGERTFQLISQVAGRAGRGGKDNPGRVIVQSFNPRDPAIVLAAAHDYEAFAQRELELRRQMGLPPVTRMARIVVRDQDHVACLDQATKLADGLAGFNAQLGKPVRLRGPSACPIARIAGYYRQQIEMIAPDAGTIQKLLTAARNARMLHADARTAVDVDPVAMM